MIWCWVGVVVWGGWGVWGEWGGAARQRRTGMERILGGSEDLVEGWERRKGRKGRRRKIEGEGY